jgi:hypothetical protein
MIIVLLRLKIQLSLSLRLHWLRTSMAIFCGPIEMHAAEALLLVTRCGHFVELETLYSMGQTHSR